MVDVILEHLDLHRQDRRRRSRTATCGSTASPSTSDPLRRATASPRARASTSTASSTGWVRRKTLPEQAHRAGQRAAPTRSSRRTRSSPTSAPTRTARRRSTSTTATRCSRGSTGKTWAQRKGDYVFELPNRSHGQVKELFPGDKSSPGHFHPALRAHDAPRAPARSCGPGAAGWIGRCPERRGRDPGTAAEVAETTV